MNHDEVQNLKLIFLGMLLRKIYIGSKSPFSPVIHDANQTKTKKQLHIEFLLLFTKKETVKNVVLRWAFLSL